MSYFSSIDAYSKKLDELQSFVDKHRSMFKDDDRFSHFQDNAQLALKDAREQFMKLCETQILDLRNKIVASSEHIEKSVYSDGSDEA